MAGLLAGEQWVRLGIGAAVFAVMAGWELAAPRRSQAVGRWIRWPNNLGILAIDTILLRVLFPAAALGAALGSGEHGWGLLNIMLLPLWIAVLVAVIVLDLAIYLQHVLFHAVPMLWRTTPISNSTSQPACGSILSRLFCRWSSSWAWCLRWERPFWPS